MQDALGIGPDLWGWVTGVFTLAYAAFQSNVGTAYRQRTQITMFFFILIGVGIEQKRNARTQAAARSSLSRPARAGLRA